MSKKFVVKGSTTDSEIAVQLTTEEILSRFINSKTQANVWDTERDRLRKFIQGHIKPGRHGKFILEISSGTPRVYTTSLGNIAVQSAIVVDVGLIPKPIKAGTQVIIIDVKSGEQLDRGVILDNKSLYKREPPQNITIVEVPDENPAPA